ncbi:hypothetical protein HNQ51_001471 [Inhella inkyongensis]|uniref:DUF692 domain-containing protein n=1 Tax=Inhella inkyongensis TaxID=392593 RepID=A0A840S3Z8_9BURK|nr:DUF692 domain-containing protein [Inhella inkyongensis]MBB5204178.1 hypothetical protein [Inhella inkyongensis]
MPGGVALCGIGWRHPHHEELLRRFPELPFIEVHSENFFGAGGAALALLQRAAEHYPVSLHGVGLGLGSQAGLDTEHLRALRALCAAVPPLRVSDHACFARVAVEGTHLHAADLLPIAFTRSSLDLLVDQVQQVQDALARPIAVENLSAYLHWSQSDMPEPEFFNELVRRSGCQLLLDLNNLMVNAHNRAEADALQSCKAWVDAIRPGSVAEIHLAGYTEMPDGLAIDDHGSAVREPVWALYRHTLGRLGLLPTLVEWDTELPTLDRLLGEAARADREAAQC